MHTELPTLYARSSTGAIKQWTVQAIEDGDHQAILRKIFGIKGGKMQTQDRVVTGKNIGRANEKTAYEQAIAEAKSDWQGKKNKNYFEDVPAADGSDDAMLPMLALDFNKRGHDIEYPCYVQPKLNGVRCLAKKIDHKTIDYRSRKGKSYNGTLAHLTPELLKFMEVGDVFDGEIFHLEMTFQGIVRRVKKLRKDTSLLHFWVYDLAVADFKFDYRMFEFFAKIGASDLIKKIPTTQVHSGFDAIKKLHDEYVQKGFEGAIIRNAKGLYKFGHRSKDLQKYKEFFDKEFEIVGGKEGSGNDAGCVIFTVKLDDDSGRTFDVRPKGTVEERRRWFQELESLKGKMLTVRYQSRSEDNVPLIVTGIAIRDYE